MAPDLRAIGIDALYERIGGKGIVKVAKSSASSVQTQPDKELTDDAQNADDADDAGALHRQADSVDAVDADGVFRGNGVTDTKQTAFAEDAEDAVVCPTFTNDNPNITPANWRAPF